MSTIARVLAAVSLAIALSAGAQPAAAKTVKYVSSHRVVVENADCAVRFRIGCPGYLLVGVGF